MTKAQANDTSPATSFPAFTRLPSHIAQRILVLACRSAPSSCHPLDAAKRGRLELDATTTTSLARVSKAINKVITPILWTSIRIVKPSALIELAAAVEARPILGQRIKNLHFGGEEMQVTSEWPLGIEVGKGKKKGDGPLPQDDSLVRRYGGAIASMVHAGPGFPLAGEHR